MFDGLDDATYSSDQTGTLTSVTVYTSNASGNFADSSSSIEFLDYTENIVSSSLSSSVDTYFEDIIKITPSTPISN